MGKMVSLRKFVDERGSLVVFDKVVPFEIKRVFWIYGGKEVRGGHRHKETESALVCVKGSCEVFVNNGLKKEVFVLDSPDRCLLLSKDDWRAMQNFSKDCVLLVMASTHYDVNDYIDEEYA